MFFFVFGAHFAMMSIARSHTLSANLSLVQPLVQLSSSVIQGLKMKPIVRLNLLKMRWQASYLWQLSKQLKYVLLLLSLFYCSSLVLFSICFFSLTSFLFFCLWSFHIVSFLPFSLVSFFLSCFVFSVPTILLPCLFCYLSSIKRKSSISHLDIKYGLDMVTWLC